ncbi:MAG: MBL fold metallo-hydrolase [Betaproteobacteria bacterium]|nr:MBL fold metallo-hydrolase [Betaproteobacteria bacterium]
MGAPKLPPQIHVIVRDWLNANNIVLRSRNGNVVIDSGYSSHAAATLSLLRRPDALGDRPLHWLINTHCHSDHMGGNAALQREYRCRVSVPEGEAPLIAAWDTEGLWLDFADQHAERFSFDDAISPGDGLELGDLAWKAIAAPGHDMGALMFHCEDEALLISGDALWEHAFGVVLPMPDGEQRLKATRKTLETIAALNVRIVIPGHGKPFSTVDLALERAFKRLEAFEADPMRVARHVVKVMLTFSLLDRGRMALADLPDYMERVPFYRDYNETYFRMQPAALAEMIVGELEKAGVVNREEGFLVPAAAAAEN